MAQMAPQPSRRWAATPAERESLIAKHAYLADVVVGRIAARLPDTVDRDDLVSHGLMGLIAAVDRYDPSRGVKFETYATTVIRGAVLDALRASDWMPRSVREKCRRLQRALAEATDAVGRQPTEQEVAEAMGIPLEEYRELLSDASVVSLESLEGLLAGGEPVEVAASEQQGDQSLHDPAVKVEKEDLKRVLAVAVDELPAQERNVVALYYYEELTLKEIGEILGVTESRVCQIHTQAVLRLRGMVRQELGL